MKNYNFSPSHYAVPWRSRYLLFALLFILGSCRKDSLSEMAVSENSTADVVQHMSSSRSSDLENQVVEYAQWMIVKMVPVVEDQAVYADIQAGLYTTTRVQAKMSALGFNNFEDFLIQFKDKATPVGEAIKTGLLTNKSLTLLLNQRLSPSDVSAMARSGGIASVPGTPCYNQLMDRLTFIVIAGAVGAIESGPMWAVVAIGVAIAMGEAIIDFHNCLDENYPLGN